MKLSDYLSFSLSNLWSRKLRSLLTVFGVMIGIGALVSMISFGKGMQKNVTDVFKKMELFNYISVFPSETHTDEFDEPGVSEPQQPKGIPLDDKAIQSIRSLRGVETAFPDIRFPGQIELNGNQEFTLVQALPVKFARSKLIHIKVGKTFSSEDEASVIIHSSLLHRFGIKDIQEGLGKKIIIKTFFFDLSSLDPTKIGSILSGSKFPIAQKEYAFTIVGISENVGLEDPSPLKSQVFIPFGMSKKMQKISVTSLWDLFRKTGSSGYSMVNARLSSPKFIPSVKEKIQQMGFQIFAFSDQFEEIQTGFLFMDMFLFAVGMIAIVVASLGITNTMVMSIMERYKEIGIMKAVGASNKDIKKVFFFETSVIGLMGGTFGLLLGWLVSGLINRVVNYFLSKQNIPHINYFDFPWWLCAGAVIFAVIISLASGVYPAMRAAKVDPAVALRHE
ncbi:MAG: FtsX-like permease family protein [Candidatus Aminicenantes bacterium]|nr:FtsX-like permease family protein [Candidatus Aminicenantes bacterium]